MSLFGHCCSKLEGFFPTPGYLSLDPVAVDILPTYVRIMKLERNEYGLTPKFYKEVPLKNRVDLAEIDFKQIESEGVKEIVEVLKALKKEFKLNYVVSSLPEAENYTYRTELPKEAYSDLSSAVKFGLEENVPLKVEDVKFDYALLDSNQEHETISVVVSVFPKKIIGLYTKIFKLADLNPISFMGESWALSKAIVRKGDGEPYLLARLLDEKVTVSIVEDCVVQYTSTIPISAKKISEDLDSKEASDLSSALNQLLIFWFTSKKDPVSHEKIHTALVTGEYADAPGIQEFLERHLKINVEVANVWTNCFSTNDFIPDIHQKSALDFSVAIGLAIKGIQHD